MWLILNYMFHIKSNASFNVIYTIYLIIIFSFFYTKLEEIVKKYIEIGDWELKITSPMLAT